MANLHVCSDTSTTQSICVLVGKVENQFPKRGRSAALDLVDRDSGEGHAILALIVSLGEPMTDLNSLALFAKVVEAGSFSEAARRLKMPISTVSRRIAELEDQLGVRLLERSTRNLRLTELGAEVLEHAVRSAELNEAVESVVSNRLSDVSGTLKLSAPPSVSDTLLTPLGHRVSGVLSERPRPDPCHRASGRSHRRGRRLGVPSGRAEGFMPRGPT